MPLTLDVSADFRLWDNPEQVTVDQRDADTGDVLLTAAHVNALSRALSAEASPLQGGEVTVRTKRIHLNAGDVPFAPAKSDTITDAAGVVWVIDTVQSQTWNTRYACDCTALPTGE